MQSTQQPGGISRQDLEMLQESNTRLQGGRLADLLRESDRFERFSRRLDGLLLDFTRVRLDDQALDELLAAARRSGLEESRDRLFSGDNVNATERRPALHMALRSPDVLAGAGGDEAARVEHAMSELFRFADALHAGHLPAAATQRVRHIVHVGIGGSLLGPRLICEALAEPGAGPEAHFLGSVDAHRRDGLLQRLDPAETAVIMVSKSFTTGDTLLHGRRLRSWLQESLGEEAAARRLFAVTSQVERAREFGIPETQLLYFSDWVGGRYSLWSPVSLSAAAAMGVSRFRRLLAGAERMDRHFREAPLADNLPILLGLLGLWHRNVCGYPAWGVMPYDERLRLLPAFLQQLIMESLGKSVTVGGRPTRLATAPVVWGETGTDAQHSVFQALHQGSDVVPLHFVGVIEPDHTDIEAHDELLANLFAQLTALATGRDAEQTRADLGGDEELLPHRTFAGDRPSELVLLDRLDPYNLGLLLALYEHKVFVESVLWDINAFDQWGVELGKTLAPGIQAALRERAHDVLGPGLEQILRHVDSVRNSQD